MQSCLGRQPESSARELRATSPRRGADVKTLPS